MKRKLGMAAALVVAMAVSGYAQKKPDFSGTWTVDTEKSDPAAAPGAGPGGGGRGGGMMGPITIKQTADSISIESQGRGGTPQTRTYKLDGSEQAITFGQMKATAKARWDGDKVIIETTRAGQDGTMFTTSVRYSLNADGTLTAENKTPMGARKVVYKKST